MTEILFIDGNTHSRRGESPTSVRNPLRGVPVARPYRDVVDLSHLEMDPDLKKFAYKAIAELAPQ